MPLRAWIQDIQSWKQVLSYYRLKRVSLQSEVHVHIYKYYEHIILYTHEILKYYDKHDMKYLKQTHDMKYLKQTHDMTYYKHMI